MPPRGIGPRTLEHVRSLARESGCALWEAAKKLIGGGVMPKRASGSLQAFLELIEQQQIATAGLALHELADQVIKSSNLPEHFRKSRDGKGQDRIENLEELVNAARQFPGSQMSIGSDEIDPEGLQSSEQLDELPAFLAHAALEAGEAQGDAFDECVQLMTLHSAKGLEFPLVFMAGLEEGLFPHSMSSQEPGRLEEERRLCYVGMTRAMQQLYLSYAESRRLHGSDSYPLPSRFLREIPAELIQEVRLGAQVSRPVYQPSPTRFDEPNTNFKLGQRVAHPKFGDGVVLNAEGSGGNTRVQVNFESSGVKWLILAYANLEPL